MAISPQPFSRTRRICQGLLTNRRKNSRPLEVAIVFDAASGLTETGKAAAQAVFSIDRTLWSVIYGSGKFFHRLAGHLVNDLIEFQIRIVSQ